MEENKKEVANQYMKEAYSNLDEAQKALLNICIRLFDSYKNLHSELCSDDCFSNTETILKDDALHNHIVELTHIELEIDEKCLGGFINTSISLRRHNNQ